MTDDTRAELTPVAWCDDRATSGGAGNCASDYAKRYWANGHWVVLPIAVVRARNYLATKEVTYEYIDKSFWGYSWKKRVPVRITHESGDAPAWLGFFTLVGFIAAIWVGLKVAF